MLKIALTISAAALLCCAGTPSVAQDMAVPPLPAAAPAPAAPPVQTMAAFATGPVNLTGEDRTLPAPEGFSCLGYNEAESTCASMRRSRIGDDGLIAFVEETRLRSADDFSVVAIGYTAFERSDGYCVEPHSVRVDVDPANSASGMKFALERVVAVKLAAGRGLCYRLKGCGDDTIIVHDVTQDDSLTTHERVRLVSHDEAVLLEMKTRFVGPAELAAIKMPVLSDCGV